MMNSTENACNKLALVAMNCIIKQVALELEFHNRFADGLDTSQVIRELELNNSEYEFTKNAFKNLK